MSTTRELTPVEIHMLLAVAEKPRHGYGIKLEVERRTDGRVRLGSGTLYVAIQRLEKEGLMRGKTKQSANEDKRRRRYFELTAAGRKVLRREMERLEALVTFARGLDLVGDA